MDEATTRRKRAAQRSRDRGYREEKGAAVRLVGDNGCVHIPSLSDGSCLRCGTRPLAFEPADVETSGSFIP